MATFNVFVQGPVDDAPTALPELVESGVIGFLEPAGNLDAHVRAVMKLLGDGALRRRFGRAGRKIAREKFEVDRVVERYRKVYEGLC